MHQKLPIVSIIGRQNVGKSTLFNSLIRKKKAIVDDFPGLTRDILNYKVMHPKAPFILSDTPGLDLLRDNDLSEAIIANAHLHLERSSVILLLLENPQIEKFDFDLIELTRRLAIPIIVAVNKMDSIEDMENMSNFYELGVADILPISSKFNRNLDLLLDKIASLLPPSQAQEHHADVKIALVGKPNAGKSTLLNSFLGYERAVVSEIPGTTRDSVNEGFQFEGKLIEVIDTAGLRKKSKIKENVEFYSLTRSLQSIKDADVVIHLIDAFTGLTDTDKKIADEIIAETKPIIIAVNKWDAVEKQTNSFEDYKEYLNKTFYRSMDFPIISISAKEKLRIHKLLTTAIEMSEKAKRRISTSKLNLAIETIQNAHRLPGLGADLKVYYATQIDTVPPQFKLFVNNEKKFRPDVMRFFQKEFQRLLDIHGIPVLIKIEGKPKRDGRRPAKPRTGAGTVRPEKHQNAERSTGKTALKTAGGGKAKAKSGSKGGTFPQAKAKSKEPGKHKPKARYDKKIRRGKDR